MKPLPRVRSFGAGFRGAGRMVDRVKHTKSKAMTKQEFLRAKLNSYTPQFKQLIGLKESGQTGELLDFMTMLHPNQQKQAQGSRGEVFGRKHYAFTIYRTGILRTVVETGARRFYPYGN